MGDYLVSRYNSEQDKHYGRFALPTEQERAKFTTWSKNLLLSNQLFYTLAKDYIEEKDYMVELTSTNEGSLSEKVRVPGIFGCEEYVDIRKGLPDIIVPDREEALTGCFVMQGIYPSYLEYIARVKNTGSFAIGIVGIKQDESYKLQKKYYKQVYDTFLKSGIPMNQPIEKNDGKFHAYILTKK